MGGRHVEQVGKLDFKGIYTAMKHKLGIIGGCGSSGTTLLTHLLSRSPYLASGPEFNCFNHKEIFDYNLLRSNYVKMFQGHSKPCGYIDVHVFMTYRDEYGISLELLEKWINSSSDTLSFFNNISEYMTNYFGKPNFIEKSPTNVYSFRELSTNFPEIPLVHLIRDGRDVVCSLMKRGFNLFGAGSRWLYDTLSGMSARGYSNYLEIRYEDLVSNPSGTLKVIFDHLGIPFDPLILQNRKDNSPGMYVENWTSRKEPRVWKQTPGDIISTASIERYKKELYRNDLLILERIKLTKYSASKLQSEPYSVKELLELLSYKIDDDMSSQENNLKQNFRGSLYEFRDYCRRVKRFINVKNYKYPRRYTNIMK